MVLALVVSGVLLALCLAVGMWFLLPTLRGLFRPGFEPASVDDEAVLRAQQAYTDGAGGASGFGV